MRTQNALVLDYLRQHKELTTWEAFDALAITRLSGRIHDLRSEGHDIVTIRRPGERFGRYVLQRKKRAA